MPYFRSLLLGITLLAVMFTAGRLGFDSANLGNHLGTDSWLRLLTLQDFLSNSDWYNHQLSRTNWPYGLELHWTRPVDFLLIPFALFLPALWAAAIYQLSLLILMGILMAHVAWRSGATWQNLALPVLLLGLFTSPYLLAYFAPARIDHHALLAVIFVGTLALLYQRKFFIAGLVAGLGIWVSVEFFVPLTFITLWMGLAWLRHPKTYHRAPHHFFLSILCVVTLAIIVERPWAEFTTIITDSVSWPHFVLIALTSFSAFMLSFQAAWRCSLTCRLSKALLYGFAIFLITFAAFPSLMSLGFLNIEDAVVRDYFADNIGELQSLVDAGYGISPFIPLLISLPLAFWRLHRNGWPQSPLLLLITTIGMSAFFFDTARWAYYALPSALLLLAYGLADPIWAKKPVLRMGIIFALIILPITLILDKEEEGEQRRVNHCHSQLSHAIRNNTLGETALNVAIDPNRGYEALFYTPHRILSANNHRNEQGLGDLLRILHGKDSSVAREIIQKRDIDRIIACPTALKPKSWLLTPPSWLEMVETTDELTPLKIWRVKFPE